MNGIFIVKALLLFSRNMAGPGSRIIKKLSDLKRDNADTDVLLICKDGTVDAHRVVLRATNDYFDAMFASKMRESASSRVEFLDWPQRVVNAVAQMLYEDKIDQELTADLDFLTDVTAFSHMISAEDIFDRCWEWMKMILNTSNFIDVWNLAVMYETESSMLPSIFHVVNYNMDAILQEDLMVDMSEYQLGLYYRNFPHGDSSAQFVLQWAAASPERTAKATEIFEGFNVKSLSEDYIRELSPVEGEAHEETDLRQLVFSKIESNLDRGECSKLVVEVFRAPHNEHLTYTLADSAASAIGCTKKTISGQFDLLSGIIRCKTITVGREVFFLVIRKGKLIICDPKTNSRFYGPGVLRTDDIVCAAQDIFAYVWTNPRSFHRFNTVKKTWRKLASCEYDIIYWSTFLIGTPAKLILVYLDYSRTSKVFEYDAGVDDWTLIQEMPDLVLYPMSMKCGSLNCKKKIYFHGNIESEGIYVVLKWDLVDDSWSTNALPERLKGKTAVCGNCEEDAVVFSVGGIFCAWYLLYYPESGVLKEFYDSSGFLDFTAYYELSRTYS